MNCFSSSWRVSVLGRLTNFHFLLPLLYIRGSDKNTMQDTKLTFLLTDLAVEPFYNSVALAQLVTKTECVTGAYPYIGD